MGLYGCVMGSTGLSVGVSDVHIQDDFWSLMGSYWVPFGFQRDSGMGVLWVLQA